MKHLRLLIPVLLAALLGMVTTTTTTAQDSFTDATWQGQYFDNAILQEPPAFTRTDADISFDWGFGAPGENVSSDTFSVRWATDIRLPAGDYRFYALADDNISVTLDFRNIVIDTFETDVVDELITRDVTLTEGVHHIQVDYREINEEAFANFSFESLADGASGPDFPFDSQILPPATPTGVWTARYYTNQNLSGAPAVIREEDAPSEDWNTGSPAPTIPVDNWSASWEATLDLNGGNYQFSAEADDGVRVYVDGNLIINEWHIASGVTYTEQLTLAPGLHTVRVEYYEAGGLAFLDFGIDGISIPDEPTNPVNPQSVTVTSASARLLATPQDNSNVLTTMTSGQTYPFLGLTADSGWVQIEVRGVSGWIDIRNVNINSGDAPDTPPQGTLYQATATPYTVNIRTGPDTSFRDIGNFPAGRTAPVIGRNTDATWWQINYQGVVGWVSARYAQIEPGADINQIPVRSE